MNCKRPKNKSRKEGYDLQCDQSPHLLDLQLFSRSDRVFKHLGLAERVSTFASLCQFGGDYRRMIESFPYVGHSFGQKFPILHHGRYELPITPCVRVCAKPERPAVLLLLSQNVSSAKLQ